MDNNTPILVLGAGSWGTALALQLAGNGQTVYLWARDAAHVSQMAELRCNTRYLPGIAFPDGLHPINALGPALQQCQDILVTVPSHAFRLCLEAIKPDLRGDARVAWATKGLEHGSHKLLHQVAIEVLGEDTPLALVSGPSFAGEVARGLPTAVTVASSHPAFSAAMAARLHHGNFRAYTSTDMIGVELGGAVKNVLAIAAGVADGLGFGANTRAALITRGLAEIMRLGEAVGGQRETFMGLAGLGDLVLTCTDNQSRNRRFGLALASGRQVDEILAEIGQVVEGMQTAREVRALAMANQVEMPICEQVYRLLFKGCSPMQAVRTLLERDPKAED